MLSNALHELYKVENAVKKHGDGNLLAEGRRISGSDHFFYRCITACERRKIIPKIYLSSPAAA